MGHAVAKWADFQAAKLSQKLFGREIFADLPAPVRESDPQDVACRPGLFEPDQLDRVRHCYLNRTLRGVMDNWAADRFTETPMETYHLGAATVLPGVIYTRSARHWFSLSVPKLADVLGSYERNRHTVLLNSMQGIRYFGHWLGDDTTVYEAYRGHPDICSVHLRDWADLGFFQAAFQQNWRQHRVIDTDNLILNRNVGFSRKKTQHWHQMRDRLRQHIQPGPGAGKVVYISRGASASQREISNWDALHRWLSDQNIPVVTPENDTAEFTRNILDADVIISVEGSQACHAIYNLRPGGALLILQPPDRFHSGAQEWMRPLDMHCGMVIGTQTETGFDINPDEVSAMADRLLNAVAAARMI
ncbi:glycosyltransferase 61 family protein [Paracoccus sp. (in: a-proteobacteria)]|uniref:glycosyltransferase 61 family protein n=1 Tax=Paracoccus sp. TaxID=267 RepID=UPI0026DEB2FA|nr:glycosyltransferase 61 family protein [Paracoccus sp. (in: a-proteobacteria)]MDO5647130.1 glycosyltransferase 61 family protein [Paracoccus sp. (in: a-proteobacteria)]